MLSHPQITAATNADAGYTVARATCLAIDWVSARFAAMGRAIDRMTRYIAAGRARGELNRMSDRELRDIGINRGDIERVIADSLK